MLKKQTFKHCYQPKHKGRQRNHKNLGFFENWVGNSKKTFGLIEDFDGGKTRDYTLPFPFFLY